MKTLSTKSTFLLLTILVIVLIVIFFIIHETSNRFIGRDIVIGVIAPLTGSHSEGGLSIKNGVETAVANINNTGGLNGHKVVLSIYNDENNPRICQEATKKLILVDNADAIIGSFSSKCTMAIKSIANLYQIPLLTPVAMDDEVAENDDYIFRNTLSVTAAQKKINSFSNVSKNKYILLDGFGGKSIGILWQNDAWGNAMQETIVKDIAAVGKQNAIIFNESFDLGETDFKSIFKKYANTYPDIIYAISSGNESNSIVRSGRIMGFNGIFFGEGGFNYASFDTSLKAYTDGCLFTTQWNPSFSTPMSDVFMKSYIQNFNETPDMFAAISYEAVYILADSLNNIIHKATVPNFRQLLQSELSKTRSFDGITGIITFDATGQCDRPMFIMQKRWDGKSVQSLILFPEKYSQGQLKWNFDAAD